MKNIHRFKRFTIPIYGAHLTVAVVNKLSDLKDKCPEFQISEDDDGYAGMCYSTGTEYMISICHPYIDLNVIAHEVFHLTINILNTYSANLDVEHQEQGSILNAYLLELVLDVMGMRTSKFRR